MKRLVLGLFTLLATSAYADDTGNLIFIQPEGGYSAPRVFAQSQTAGYSGINYGGSVYYKIGDSDFAWAPYAKYTFGNFNSTANSSTQSEKLSEKTLSLGLKIYLGDLFLRAGYDFVKVDDKTSGQTSQSLSDDTHGLSGGIGMVFGLTEYVRLEVSADVSSAHFSAKLGGFSSASQYLRFGGTVGLGIILPSTPPRRTTFKALKIPND